VDETQDRQKAIERRNRATRGVRRVTLAAAALATAAAGVIAAVVGNSGTPQKTNGRILLGGANASRSTIPAVPEPSATVAASAAPSSSGSAAPSPPQAAPSPSAASAPVVVSGGS
jgi:hypothetical protein